MDFVKATEIAARMYMAMPNHQKSEDVLYGLALLTDSIIDEMKLSDESFEKLFNGYIKLLKGVHEHGKKRDKQ